MSSRRTRKVRLVHFTSEQLEQIIGAYDEIGARLRELRAVTKVRLPRTSDKTRRLAVMSYLIEREKLTIRITDSGNLSVRALVSPSLGEQKTYAVLIRRPAIPR